MRGRRPVLPAAAICLLFWMTACGDAEAPPVGPGVSRELAEGRSRTISDLRYELRFILPADPGVPVEGQAYIEFDLARRGPVVLDFAGRAAPPPRLYTGGEGPMRNLLRVAPVVEGRPGEWEPLEAAEEHLVVPARHLRKGRNGLLLRFTAGDGPLNRSEGFLYTLFVPARAREAFPCFDQPDLKARFSLSLVLPEGWAAVSNTPGERRGSEIRFEETAPLPTYLFSFAAGRFRFEARERAGRTLRLFHRETDSARVARNLEPVFDLQGRALEWLEAYTGIPLPFPKFDFVAVPSFQYGGMEHPGAVLYRADRLFLDETATKEEELERASLIAHETAHMWFGDLVTMSWFDDVWMKEVFANFLAAKIVHPSFPELDHELRFLLAHHPPAYAVDRSGGTHPIRQELENLAEAGSLYGPIIYRKAPIVMRHLERLVGEATLRAGLREYLRAHAFGNAGWPELIEILDRRTSHDLAAWSRVWVEEPGRPTVELRMPGEAEAGAGVDAVGRAGGAGPAAEGPDGADTGPVALLQRDPLGRAVRWPQRLGLRSGGPDGRTRASTEALLDDGSVSVRLPTSALRTGPGLGWLLANGGGLGYGYFPLEPGTRSFVLECPWAVREAVPRAVAWLSLWDDLLEGRVPATAVLEATLRALEREEEELLVSRLLDDLGTLYWRLLPSAERRALAPRVEALLWRRLVAAGSRTSKAAWFGAYRSLALGDEANARLRRLWGGELAVEGLALSERDRTALALALAVREVDGWREVLDAQAEAIENPDRRARFGFLRPAADADPAVRERFFRSLDRAENRTREPWVADGLALLHHPLRAEASLGHIRPALELLEEVRRTGDIFFPQRWLDATLGGHGSPEAAAVVRSFLGSRPHYPPRLRRQILQSADLLFRAARMR